MEEKELLLVNTFNNSKTLYSKKYKEHYHNLNGPEIESEHIFINLGLRAFVNKRINILEIGYGTGLNAMMTFLENYEFNNTIYYHGIDIEPLNKETFELLNYSLVLGINKEFLEKFYLYWNEPLILSKNFTLHKEHNDFNKFYPSKEYDLIYFDAFSPEVQPEMWSIDNLKKILTKLSVGGIFVTYCSKGIVKQNLRALGMEVKRFSGPLGKRHVIKAIKKIKKNNTI